MKKKYSAPTAKVQEYDIAEHILANSGAEPGVKAKTVRISGYRGTLREFDE